MQTNTFAHSCPDQDRLRRRVGWPRPAALSLCLVTLFLSGCAGYGPSSITVGSIPDDYRTNHPIIVAEKEHSFDLPVGSGDRKLTVAMREAVRGVASNYRANASGAVRIIAPSGSLDAGAAQRMAGEVAEVLRSEGIPRDRIITSYYQAGSGGDAAPIRISYLAITASTNECGRWPEDMLANSADNKHYANFGCASQNNLAAQIANPGDLLNPRGSTAIDATRRANAIDAYRQNGAAL
ncbi:CpaD family pilus assembly protein [Hoeflea olei]|uniref:Pilus assembly protein n=1 Tax=Hoeflea olei TaxID=1480615 RepID=A0A1C1YWZ5_9HYPH|nr:CpaD family pilus assembly lipoprotein [Hoeflea olei]OCW58073.1 pilus assembly protein [Hoeflea olei]